MGKYCPNCKKTYREGIETCDYCNAQLTDEPIYSIDPETHEKNKTAFRQKFWSAFWIMIVGAFFGVWFLKLAILLAFAICFIAWIVNCVTKAEGKHGWIAGLGAGIAVGALIFGSCLSVMF